MSRMKVFLDTNILVSMVEQRNGVDKILPIIQMASDGMTENCASILTFANMSYILGKAMTRAQVESTLRQYSSLITVLPMNARQFEVAFEIEGPDFEDKLQMACAALCSCDFIITENIRDFYGATIPTFTPSQFLDHIRTRQGVL